MSPTAAPSPASSRHRWPSCEGLWVDSSLSSQSCFCKVPPHPPVSHRPSLPPWGSGAPLRSVRPQPTRPSPASVQWSVSAQPRALSERAWSLGCASRGVCERGSGEHDKVFSGRRFPRSTRGNPDANRRLAVTTLHPRPWDRRPQITPGSWLLRAKLLAPRVEPSPAKPPLRLQGGRPLPLAAVAIPSRPMDRLQCGARPSQPTGPHRGPPLI